MNTPPSTPKKNQQKKSTVQIKKKPEAISLKKP